MARITLYPSAMGRLLPSDGIQKVHFNNESKHKGSEYIYAFDFPPHARATKAFSTI